MNEYDDGGSAKPQIEKVGTKYLIGWPDGCQVTIDRIYPHKNMHVDCEVTVEDFAEIGGTFLLGPQRMTLTRSPKSVLDDLSRVSNREDWKQKFLQVTKLVLDDIRRGEPIINLNERTSPEQPPEMVSSICYEGTPTVIYGEGGIGKSMIGLTIATAVHNGMEVENGFQVMQGNAMVLDYETSWEETYRRSRDIIKGFDTNLNHVYYRYCSQPLYQDVESLRNQIAELDIRFLLIDSAGPACGGEPENASATLQYFQALRALTDSDVPLTTLTLAHVTKNNNGSTPRNPFGSVYWVNMPRNTFELRKGQQPEENYIEIALHHRKTNVGRLRQPMSFRLTWSAGQMLVKSIDMQNSSLSKTNSIPKQAQDLLSKPEHREGLTTSEICRELGFVIETDLYEEDGEPIFDIDREKSRTLQASLSRSNLFYSVPKDGGNVWKLTF